MVLRLGVWLGGFGFGAWGLPAGSRPKGGASRPSRARAAPAPHSPHPATLNPQPAACNPQPATRNTANLTHNPRPTAQLNPTQNPKHKPTPPPPPVRYFISTNSPRRPVARSISGPTNSCFRGGVVFVVLLWGFCRVFWGLPGCAFWGLLHDRANATSHRPQRHAAT